MVEKHAVKDVKRKNSSNKTIKNWIIGILTSLLILMFVTYPTDAINAKNDYEKQIEQLKTEQQNTEQFKSEQQNIEQKVKDLTEKNNELTLKNEQLEKDKNSLNEQLSTVQKELEELKNSNNKKNDNSVTTSVPTSTPAQTSGTSNKQTSSSTNNTYTVYITKTGKKYHRAGCSSLSKSQISINKNDAISQGYTPCLKCNP